MPGVVAWSDARPPGMQRIAGLILMPGTFFCGYLVMKKILRPFSPSRWFKKGSYQLGGLPRNSVVRLTDRTRNDLKKCWRAVKHQLNTPFPVRYRYLARYHDFNFEIRITLSVWFWILTPWSFKAPLVDHEASLLGVTFTAQFKIECCLMWYKIYFPKVYILGDMVK